MPNQVLVVDDEAAQLRESAPPDLILSDIAMPGLDGAAFIKAPRASLDGSR